MARTPEREAAFRATAYQVFMPQGLVELRVDARVPAAIHELAPWALLTAANPGAVLLTPAENQVRQARLEVELLALGHAVYYGENIADASDWPVEDSCLVSRLSLADARELAHRHGQLAFLCGDASGVACLTWV